MNLSGRECSRFHNIYSVLCACLAIAFVAGLSGAAAAAFHGPPIQSSSSPGLAPVILSEGWAIHDIQTNDLGSVAFIGGGRYYDDDTNSGVADGIVLVTADGINKFAAVGDPVPDRPGRVFAGFTSKSLNNSDDVAFIALTLPAGDSTNCLQLPWPSNCSYGLYLYSSGHVRAIAQPGDIAPDTGGLSYTGFGEPQLNDLDMIAFSASAGSEEAGSQTGGYFLFDGNTVHKIVLIGDNSPVFGMVGLPFYSSPFFLSSGGTLTFCVNGILAQYGDGKLSRILGPGDAIPGDGTVPEFVQLVSISGNRKGEVVFQISGIPLEKSGIYLIRRDGRVERILSSGDPSPDGGQFSLTYTYYQYHIPQTGLSNSNPQLNNSGEVLFVSSVTGGSSAAGIFLYSNGQFRAMVADGQPIASRPGLTIRLLWTDNYFVYTLLNKISFAPLGEVVFSAWQARYPSDISYIGIFRLAEGTISPAAVQGDVAPGTGGQFANVSFPYVEANSLGDVIFLSGLLGSSYPRGIFRASLASPDIPNAGFEDSTRDGLPEHWTTTWTNYGKGEAEEYDGGKQDSFEGKLNLRLHVAPGGGGVFVVSDAITVSPGTDYFLQCRMRYNLSGGSDAVYFTVIQSDAGGNTVGLTEMKGVQGDNFWIWQSQKLMIRTASNAAAIRIRFGLIAASETYTDIDALGGRDGP